MSNRIVPKHHNIHNLSCTAFVPVSNRTVPKQTSEERNLLLSFVPVSNETVPKSRNSLFSFQQLTINISSPIVVTRA